MKSLSLIKRWHRGKLVILWTWASIAFIAAITEFLKADTHKGKSSELLLEITFILIVPFLLSVLTWYWVGNEEQDESAVANQNVTSKPFHSMAVIVTANESNDAEKKSIENIQIPPAYQAVVDELVRIRHLLETQELRAEKKLTSARRAGS